MQATVHMKMSEKNLWELILSFHSLGPGDLNLGFLASIFTY